MRGFGDTDRDPLREDGEVCFVCESRPLAGELVWLCDDWPERRMRTILSQWHRSRHHRFMSMSEKPYVTRKHRPDPAVPRMTQM